MPYSLKGRNVLVTGGSRGLGALVCEKFAAEGANIAVNYLSSKDRGQEVVEKCIGMGVKAVLIQGDAAARADNIRIVKETVEQLGGIDVIIANAGWTRFSNFFDMDALTDEEWDKSWMTNVMSHLSLVKAALPVFDQNPDGGVYLITSSIAGTFVGGSSMAYSVTKAAGLHLMKCIAKTQGPKLRINAILPGLLLTEWGQKYSKEAIEAMNKKAPLKHETDLDDCADAFINAAKNTSMTGQYIVVDSGLGMHTVY